MFGFFDTRVTSLNPQSIIKLEIRMPEKSRSTLPNPKLKFISVAIFVGN